MIKEHPSDIGERTEAIILAELVKRKFKVLIPFGTNQRYDLVFEDNGSFKKVQCKTGRLRNGCVLFNARSTHGHRGKPSRKYIGEIDFFMVYCPDTDKIYSIPIEDIKSESPYLRVAPPKGTRQYNINWASDYEL